MKLIKKSHFVFSFIISVFLSFYSLAGTYSPKDSIGFEVGEKKSYILHQIEPKETFYALSRRYKVQVKEIQAANPSINGLSIGDVVKIPVTLKPSDKAKDSKRDKNAGPRHVVQASETLYSISRKYDVTVDEIKEWNDLVSNEISIGQELVVTASGKNNKERIVTEKPKEESPEKEKGISEPKSKDRVPESLPEGAIVHIVEASQTLYALSKLYEVSSDEIKNWNDLSGDELHEGQKILLMKTKTKVPEKKKEEAKFEDYDASMKKIVKAEIASDKKVDDITNPDYKKVVEVGLAEVIDGTLDSQKFLALHRTAPIGTIMQVKNEMNNLSVFVRVIGKLPDTGVNDKVVLKISKTAFDKLSAVDNRFRVEISYVK